MTVAAFFFNLLLLLVAFVVVLFTAIYIYLKKQYKYWKELGVQQPEPVMLIGNMKQLLLLELTESQLMDQFYKNYEGENFIGIYNLWNPILLVRDSDMAKNILECDFEHFTDHPDLTGTAQSDSVFRSIFTQKGTIWKTRRQLLTKLFTPKRLKDYMKGVDASVKIMLEEISSSLEENEMDVNFEKVLEKHTIRTICSAMYGVDLAEDKVRISKLAELADVISHPPVPTVLKVLFYSVWPKLFNKMKMQALPYAIWEYFSSFAEELVQARETDNIERDDLLALVMKLKDEGAIQFGRIPFEEVVGHIHTFFAAGHHTTELTMCHVILQLCLHQDKQEKLIQEVENVLKGEKNITYDHLKQMTYMDNVIAETMRIYPLLGVLKRICTKTYKIDDQITIPKGMDVIIPVQSLQMDPRYFPEPDKFLPERFSDMEKVPYAFMPFGRGPRICIGMKFAEIAMKLTIARILMQYKVLPSEKMNFPIKFDPRTIFVTNRPLGGVYVKLKKREDLIKA